MFYWRKSSNWQWNEKLKRKTIEEDFCVVSLTLFLYASLDKSVLCFLRYDFFILIFFHLFLLKGFFWSFWRTFFKHFTEFSNLFISVKYIPHTIIHLIHIVSHPRYLFICPIFKSALSRCQGRIMWRLQRNMPPLSKSY